MSLTNFKFELGQMSTKLRYEIGREEGEKVDNEEEITEEMAEKIEELDAKSRLPHDPLLAELDLRKRCVTDTKENSRVIMPKPVSIKEEANINIREASFESVFNQFYSEDCNEKGKQKANLSKSEMSGLAKLRKRVDNGTIVVMETDKSGKFAVASIDAYVEMGQAHISQDKEIDQSEVDSKERYLNGHVSMILKVFNVGSDWQHEDRHRESNIKHSGYVSVMSLLLKDHKDVFPIPTRAVVSGNEGIGSSFSNIMSEILEPLADTLESSEKISTEDFIHAVEECNDKLAEEWKEGEKVGILGFDVKNLFGSMSARNTARVVRDRFIESELEVKGVDYKSAAMYVRYGYNDAEIRALKLDRIVPVRRYTRGQAPGLKSAEAKHKDREKDEVKWVFPDVEPTKPEQRRLLGAVLEIGVRAAFENSVYQFGGRYYHQQKGSPTGWRLTMAAARVIMSDWSINITKILEQANIKIWLKSHYVDDIRKAVTLFSNLRWDEASKAFKTVSSDEMDTNENIKYCANEIRKAMESINPDLKFTIELEQDFSDNKLPTLDLSMWLKVAMFL